MQSGQSSNDDDGVAPDRSSEKVKTDKDECKTALEGEISDLAEADKSLAALVTSRAVTKSCSCVFSRRC